MYVGKHLWFWKHTLFKLPTLKPIHYSWPVSWTKRWKHLVSKVRKTTSRKPNSVMRVAYMCVQRASKSASSATGVHTWMIEVKLALQRFGILLWGQLPVEAVLAQDRHLPLVVINLVLAKELHDLLAYWRLVDTHYIMVYLTDNIQKWRMKKNMHKDMDQINHLWLQFNEWKITRDTFSSVQPALNTLYIWLAASFPCQPVSSVLWVKLPSG